MTDDTKELQDYLEESGILKTKRYNTLLVDYHDFSYPAMPKEDREKFNLGPIYINGAKCLKCGWFIRSHNRHDYRKCKCKAIAVDGGSWYAKRSGKPEDMQNIIVEFEDE